MGAHDAPNQNYIVGWVLRTVAIPNINPAGVMKTVQVLMKQAIEKRAQKKVMAPVSETKDVQLEKVPESKLRRTQVRGYIKREEAKSQPQPEESARQAFRERIMAKKKEDGAAASTLSVPTVKITRKLPSIPSGGSQGIFQSESKETVQSESKFCPFCGGNLNWKFCPFCGKPLPHDI